MSELGGADVKIASLRTAKGMARKTNSAFVLMLRKFFFLSQNVTIIFWAFPIFEVFSWLCTLCSPPLFHVKKTYNFINHTEVYPIFVADFIVFLNLKFCTYLLRVISKPPKKYERSFSKVVLSTF